MIQFMTPIKLHWGHLVRVHCVEFVSGDQKNVPWLKHNLPNAKPYPDIATSNRWLLECAAIDTNMCFGTAPILSNRASSHCGNRSFGDSDEMCEITLDRLVTQLIQAVQTSAIRFCRLQAKLLPEATAAKVIDRPKPFVVAYYWTCHFLFLFSVCPTFGLFIRRHHT